MTPPTVGGTPFPGALLYLVLGVALVVAIVAPRMFRSRPVSSPLVLLAFGVVVGLLPFSDPLVVSLDVERSVVERTTELTVLVSLMGAGLAIDRPLSFRDRSSWGRWRPTWIMLGVAMPIGIAGIALLGWGLGLAPAVALLVASALAPTDPVLASEVQVEGPNAGRRTAASDGGSAPDASEPGSGDADEADADGSGDTEAEAHPVDDEEHEVRFTLTSEASMNDGLAFPFVHAAILLASAPAAAWIGHWLAWELVGKIVLGVGVGMALGWILGWVAFNAPVRSLRVAETGEALMGLAAVLLTYGAAELIGGYGFLAVAVAALTFRSRERTDRYHQALHEVVEHLELLLTLFVLLGLGFAISRGIFAALDWRSFVIVFVLLFVARPLPAMLALRASRRLTPHDRAIIGFFGIRGIGTLYYTAYALGHADFPHEEWVWATIALAVTVSVLVHGVTATPALEWLDRRNERREERKRRRASASA